MPNTDNTNAPKNENNSFDSLVKRYYKAVYRFSLRLVGSTTRAEDLTQETFLRAFRSFATFDTARPPLPWLARIARNLHIDKLRTQSNREEISLEGMIEQANGEVRDDLLIPDTRSNPEQLLMENQIDERLQEALHKLPEQYRNTVVLCDLQGLSYDEIASITGASAGTVRSRLHRGRQLLKKILLPEPQKQASLVTKLHTNPLVA